MITRARRWAILFALLASQLSAHAQPAHAQDESIKASRRLTMPSGAEIAAAARAVTLDHTAAAGATMFGRPFRFTPARLSGTLEDGAVIGVLENGAEGDETGLPPGKYNLYTAKVGEQWKTFAEAGGRIVREAIRTTVAVTERSARPTFTTKGWCITVTQLSPTLKSRAYGAYVTHVCF